MKNSPLNGSNNKKSNIFSTLWSITASILYGIELIVVTAVDLALIACLVYVCMNPILTLIQLGLSAAVLIVWHLTGLSAHSRLWAYFTSKTNPKDVKPQKTNTVQAQAEMASDPSKSPILVTATLVEAPEAPTHQTTIFQTAPQTEVKAKEPEASSPARSATTSESNSPADAQSSPNHKDDLLISSVSTPLVNALPQSQHATPVVTSVQQSNAAHEEESPFVQPLFASEQSDESAAAFPDSASKPTISFHEQTTIEQARAAASTIPSNQSAFKTPIGKKDSSLTSEPLPAFTEVLTPQVTSTFHISKTPYTLSEINDTPDEASQSASIDASNDEVVQQESASKQHLSFFSPEQKIESTTAEPSVILENNLSKEFFEAADNVHSELDTFADNVLVSLTTSPQTHKIEKSFEAVSASSESKHLGSVKLHAMHEMSSDNSKRASVATNNSGPSAASRAEKKAPLAQSLFSKEASTEGELVAEVIATPAKYQFTEAHLFSDKKTTHRLKTNRDHHEIAESEVNNARSEALLGETTSYFATHYEHAAKNNLAVSSSPQESLIKITTETKVSLEKDSEREENNITDNAQAYVNQVNQKITDFLQEQINQEVATSAISTLKDQAFIKNNDVKIDQLTENNKEVASLISENTLDIKKQAAYIEKETSIKQAGPKLSEVNSNEHQSSFYSKGLFAKIPTLQSQLSVSMTHTINNNSETSELKPSNTANPVLLPTAIDQNNEPKVTYAIEKISFDKLFKVVERWLPVLHILDVPLLHQTSVEESDAEAVDLFEEVYKSISEYKNKEENFELAIIFKEKLNDLTIKGTTELENLRKLIARRKDRFAYCAEKLHKLTENNIKKHSESGSTTLRKTILDQYKSFAEAINSLAENEALLLDTKTHTVSFSNGEQKITIEEALQKINERRALAKNNLEVATTKANLGPKTKELEQEISELQENVDYVNQDLKYINSDIITYILKAAHTASLIIHFIKNPLINNGQTLLEHGLKLRTEIIGSSARVTRFMPINIHSDYTLMLLLCSDATDVPKATDPNAIKPPSQHLLEQNLALAVIEKAMTKFHSYANKEHKNLADLSMAAAVINLPLTSRKAAAVLSQISSETSVDKHLDLIEIISCSMTHLTAITGKLALFYRRGEKKLPADSTLFQYAKEYTAITTSIEKKELNVLYEQVSKNWITMFSLLSAPPLSEKITGQHLDMFIKASDFLTAGSEYPHSSNAAYRYVGRKLLSLLKSYPSSTDSPSQEELKKESNTNKAIVVYAFMREAVGHSDTTINTTNWEKLTELDPITALDLSMPNNRNTSLSGLFYKNRIAPLNLEKGLQSLVLEYISDMQKSIWTKTSNLAAKKLTTHDKERDESVTKHESELFDFDVDTAFIIDLLGCATINPQATSETPPKMIAPAELEKLRGIYHTQKQLKLMDAITLQLDTSPSMFFSKQG